MSREIGGNKVRMIMVKARSQLPGLWGHGGWVPIPGGVSHMQSQTERSDLGQQGQSQAWKDPCHSLVTCLQIRERQTFRGVRLTST